MMGFSMLRVAIGLSIVLAIIAGLWKIHHSIDAAGYKRAQDEYTAHALKAEQAAREKEAALLAEKTQLEKRYAESKKRNAVDAANAQSELDILRNVLSTTSSTGQDTTTVARINGARGLESELLGNCAQALVAMGKDADRLEAKVVGLQEYVAKVCQAK